MNATEPLTLARAETSLAAWITRYEQLAVAGVRSPEIARKIALQLGRFLRYFQDSYAHDDLARCLRRDVATWRQELIDQGRAPATVNSHLATLSAFTSWVAAQAPDLFAYGDPAKGIQTLGLPPLEPRALSDAQVRSLKNLCDRLPRLMLKKGKQAQRAPATHVLRRPWRDRAIVFVLLSTGLRREELAGCNLAQVEPHEPAALRRARKGQIADVVGKGRSMRTVFLSLDARQALADYLEQERAADAAAYGTEPLPVFLAAANLPNRATDGRLGLRAVNLILEQIGRLHDGEQADPQRRVSPLRPHDLRHTFAFQLAKQTGADAYELERRLGHRSQRYIQRYTNPPAAVAAGYVEGF